MAACSRFTTILITSFFLFTGLAVGAGRGAKEADTEALFRSPSLQVSPVMAFLPAGDQGGGVLMPGTFFPPASEGFVALLRTSRCLKFTTLTDGLPPGAYTVWWALINNPSVCIFPDEEVGSVCGLPDLLGGNPEVDGAVFLAGGGLVEEDGVGEFSARVCVNSDLGFPASGLSVATGPEVVDHVTGEVTAANLIGPQHLFGELNNPKGAFVWSIIKYHGPASEDPAAFYSQTHTLLGSCQAGANGFLDPTGIVQCFDPQFAFFNPRGGEGAMDEGN